MGNRQPLSDKAQIDVSKLLPTIITELQNSNAREELLLFQQLLSTGVNFNITTSLQSAMGIIIMPDDIINEYRRYLVIFKGYVNLMFNADTIDKRLPNDSSLNPWYLDYEDLPDYLITFGNLILKIFHSKKPLSGAYLIDAPIVYIQRKIIGNESMVLILLHLSSFPRLNALDEMRRSRLDALLRIPEVLPIINLLKTNYIHFQIFQSYIQGPSTIIIPHLSWYSKVNNSYVTKLMTSKDALNQLFISGQSYDQLLNYVAQVFHSAANQPLLILTEIDRIAVSMNGANVNLLLPPIYLSPDFIVYLSSRPVTCPGNAASVDSQPVESIIAYLNNNGFTLFAGILHRYLVDNELFNEHIDNTIIFKHRLTLFAVKDCNLSPKQFAYNLIDYSYLEEFLLRHLILSNPDSIDSEDGTYFSEQLGAADTFILKSVAGNELHFTKFHGQLYITNGSTRIGFREFDICKLDGVIHVIKKPLIFEHYLYYKKRHNDNTNIIAANNILSGKINKMSSYIYYVISVMKARSHVIIVVIVNFTVFLLTVISFR